MSTTFKGLEIESPFTTAVIKRFDPTACHDGLTRGEFEDIQNTTLVAYTPLSARASKNREVEVRQITAQAAPA